MLDLGPRYESTLTNQGGNDYSVLTDEWGTELVMPALDQVNIDCSLAVGNEAQMRFGTSTGQYGRPLPVKVGLTNWDGINKYSKGQIDRVQFRNVPGQPAAEIIVDVWGL